VQPLIEHSTRAAGCATRVLELEGDGPGLVLLHGWGDSADTWRPLLALLGGLLARAPLSPVCPGSRASCRSRPPGWRCPAGST
jgi:pimeloyl-ACP methyl ester carboxylesterase